jgi:RNA polymerase sigma factor (sigma-70 family)
MNTNADAFELFLSRLEPELPSSSERYLRLRNKLIKFFQWKHCKDPEGLADETIGRTVKNLYAGDQIDKPSSYVYAVATNIFREYVRREARLSEIHDSSEPGFEESDAFGDCARHCFDKLSDDKKALLEQYYSDEEGRGEMAGRLGVSLAGLRTRIHRIRAEARECYQKCIKGI